jgi:riboflavin kinase/FMN adenylyltransferase
LKIYHAIDEFVPGHGLVVTIGTFDGVHLGHAKLISRIREVALTSGGQTLILTFFPHPRMVLYPDEHGIELLNTMREKEALLREAGIDHLVIHPFDHAFSQMDSADFIREIIHKKLNTKTLVIGYDHHFGRARKGSIDDLNRLGPELGFQVDRIEEEDVHDMAVSSTRIRNALKMGQVEQASQLLGRAYSLTGKVVAGDKLGRTIGFPTANIHIPESYKLIPGQGVYVVKYELEGQSGFGMLNIGTRPTVQANGKLVIEAHLLDFDREIYGAELTLHLLTWIRPGGKFRNLEALKGQLVKDRDFTRAYLQSHQNP